MVHLTSEIPWCPNIQEIQSHKVYAMSFHAIPVLWKQSLYENLTVKIVPLKRNILKFSGSTWTHSKITSLFLPLFPHLPHSIGFSSFLPCWIGELVSKPLAYSYLSSTYTYFYWCSVKLHWIIRVHPTVTYTGFAVATFRNVLWCK